MMYNVPHQARSIPHPCGDCMIRYAVLVATGHPSHISQLIQDRPPAMLPAIGKPMVVRVAERLYRSGIRHFIVIVGLSEGSVASYLKKQWVADAHTEFMLETDQEGTAQLLPRIARQLQEPFIIASYNSFTHENFPSSLLNMHAEHPDHLILSSARFALTHLSAPYFVKQDEPSRLEIDRTRAKNENGMLLAEYAVFGAAVVRHLAALPDVQQDVRHFLDLALAYAQQPDSLKLINETSWVLCVERDEDLLLLNRRLLEEAQDTHILSELHQTVRIIPPVRIDPQVTVGQNATIGPYVYLERGSSVGQGAVVSNAVILGRGSVQAKQVVSNAIISTRGMISS